MEIYTVLEKLALWAGALGLLVFIWKASAAVTKMQVSLEEIKTNHLPHIYDRLEALSTAILERKNGRN